MNRKALFISTQFPFPPFSGGKLVSLQHLGLISQIYQIDVVCKASSYPNASLISEFKQIYPVNELYIFEHWIKTKEHKVKATLSLLQSLCSMQPYKILKHFNRSVENKIEQLLKHNDYDLVVFDQLPSLQYSTLLKVKCSHLMFAHNAEFETVTAQIKAQKIIIKKLLFKWESYKLKRYEKKIYKKIRNVIFLSHHDAQKFIAVKNPLILPTYATLFKSQKRKMTIAPMQQKQLFLVSSWSWSLNSEGLLWFIEKVGPNLKTNIEVIIAGDGIDDPLKNKLQKNKRIKVVGKVKDVNPFYTNSHIAIIPLFGGSGIKIKVVDAMAHGIPIVTTSFGVQGLERFSDGICIADDVLQFTHHIHSILENNLVYQKYQKRIEESYLELQKQEINKSLNMYLDKV